VIVEQHSIYRIHNWHLDILSFRQRVCASRRDYSFGNRLASSQYFLERAATPHFLADTSISTQ
jgi:hypothetical protein